MSTNYHSALVAGAPADADVLEVPMGQLDDALTKALTGQQEFDGIKLDTTFTTTTLVGTQMTYETGKLTYAVKASSGTVGSLQTINSGVDGNIAILKAFTGHTITVQNFLPSPVTLSNNRLLVLIKVGGAWQELNSSDGRTHINRPISSSVFNSQPVDQLELPAFADDSSENAVGALTVRKTRVLVTPSGEARNTFGIRFASLAVYPSMVAAPTVTGTVTAVNDSTDTFNNYASAAAIAAAAGAVSTTFNVWRRNHAPLYSVRFKTAADITNQRIWVGLCAAATGNVDLPTTAFIGIRYSSAASDTSFRAVYHNGTAATVEDNLVAVTPDTIYDLSIRWDMQASLFVISLTAGGRYNPTASAQFEAGGAPPPDTELGFIAQLYASTAAARSFRLSRVYGEYGIN
jgi:hypothetical protein